MADDLAITLDAEHRARLEALAAETRQAPAQLAARAVSEFVDYEAEFRTAVQEGLTAVVAGEVRDFDDVERDLRIYMTEKLRQSGA